MLVIKCTGLNIRLSNIESADFLLFHGTKKYLTSTDDVDIELELFKTGDIDKCVQRDMNIAIEKGITAICCNQDYKAIMPGGKVNFMPGILRNAYEELGGEVKSWGKPDQEFFDAAIDKAYELYAASFSSSSQAQAQAPKSRKKFRVLHIGDSIHHDISGDIYIYPPLFHYVLFITYGILTCIIIHSIPVLY